VDKTNSEKERRDKPVDFILNCKKNKLDYEHMGDCHHIAIALNRITGLPIVFFYGERLLDHEEPEYVMVHCGVDYKGEFVDFCGRSGLGLEEAFDEYARGNDPYDDEEITHHKNEKCEEFKRLVSMCGSSVEERRVQYFIKKIKKRVDFSVKAAGYL